MRNGGCGFYCLCNALIDAALKFIVANSITRRNEIDLGKCRRRDHSHIQREIITQLAFDLLLTKRVRLTQ